MPGTDNIFLDTNVGLYALGTDEEKRAVARPLSAQSPVISIQVLSEASTVLNRKAAMPKHEITTRLGEIRALAAWVQDLNLAVLSRAWHLWKSDTIGWYDSLIVAVALEARCSVLHSEDMQDGRVFDGQLTVKNPFRARSSK
jgi:predicted nucleic acid-binding protein